MGRMDRTANTIVVTYEQSSDERNAINERYALKVNRHSVCGERGWRMGASDQTYFIDTRKVSSDRFLLSVSDYHFGIFKRFLHISTKAVIYRSLVIFCGKIYLN
jgi:hypothetical protein